MKKYKAVIIGAGSIGALKPDKYDSKESENILTVAHAFYKHEQIDLIGIVDINLVKAQRAARKWEAKSYEYLMQVEDSADIIAICVDTKYHLSVSKQICDMKNPPKVIVMEKPAGVNLEEAEEIKKLFYDKNIPVIVDYIRRYCPTVLFIQQLIKKYVHTTYSARVIYTRGLIHEACHAIDMLNFFFGDMKRGFILDEQNPIIDRDYTDPSYSVFMEYEKCPNVMMSPASGEKFAVFEMDILHEKGRIVFNDHWLRLNMFELEDEPVYGDYKMLSSTPSTYKTELKYALSNLAQSAINTIEKGNTICAIDDAIKVYKVYDKLFKEMKNGKSVM